VTATVRKRGRVQPRGIGSTGFQALFGKSLAAYAISSAVSGITDRCCCLLLFARPPTLSRRDDRPWHATSGAITISIGEYHATRISNALYLAVSASLATQTPHAAAAGLELDEIVVTAQKREQRLQDVPVAVSAISGEAIASQGITRIEGIGQLAPSLNVTAGIKSTQAGISIRGIGNNSTFGAQVEPAVLVVFDDVSRSRAARPSAP